MPPKDRQEGEGEILREMMGGIPDTDEHEDDTGQETAAEELEETEETEETDQQDDQQLIFGKYRTLEDAHNAYNEAVRKMHEEAQRRAELERYLLQQHGVAQTTAQPQEQAATDQDFWERYNSEFYDNPAENIIKLTTPLVEQIVQQRVNQIMSATNNRAAALQSLEQQPYFKEVRADVESVLAQAPPEMLANPQQAATLADQAYNYVLGMKLRSGQLSTAGSGSKQQAAAMSRMAGVNLPDSGDSGDDTATIAPEERMALKDILQGGGLQVDNEATRRIIANARKRAKGE